MENDILNERDHALFAAYQKVIDDHGSMARHLPKSLLYEQAVEQPAPKFFVSPAQAARIINNLLKGKSDPKELQKAREKK